MSRSRDWEIRLVGAAARRRRNRKKPRQNATPKKPLPTARMGQGRFAGGSGFDATAGNFGDGLAIVESFVSLGTFTEASSDPSGETPGDGAGAVTRDVVVAGDAVNGVF